MDVRSLVEYHHHLWRRFADFYVEACSWDELSQNHETSHHTIANVTMHAVNMEDWWLHHLLPGKPWAGPRWDGFRDAGAMRDRIHEVEARTKALLASQGRADLDRPRTIRSEGVEGEWTLGEILTEVVNEATHHRGEVLAMLWRINKEPPYVSYLGWLDEEKTARAAQSR